MLSSAVREGPVAASDFVTKAIIRGIFSGANGTQVTSQAELGRMQLWEQDFPISGRHALSG
jgi:hypothetical protein